MVTTLLESTVLLCLMAAPRLSPTVLMMPPLAMLLMSSTRELLSPMSHQSQLMPQPQLLLFQLLLPKSLMLIFMINYSSNTNAKN
jgi:hypothetical protein